MNPPVEHLFVSAVGLIGAALVVIILLWRRPKPLDVDELADSLLGTCDDIDSALASLGHEGHEMTSEECARLDDLICRCEQCGWWVDALDVDENQKCEDCRDE